MTRDEKWLLEEKYAGEETVEFEEDKKRLAAGEPLAYVIGWQPFLGLKIFLDSHPLIPRTETEWWVDHLLRMWDVLRPTSNVGRSTSHILDLCAGSGAIGCAALAKMPNVQVHFGELDLAHEATILKNIRENHLDESCADIRIGDLFDPFADEQFDIIAANPPYIPAGRVLDASVADHEPPLALFAGADGLDLIRRIAEALPSHLAPGGVAWVEVDSAHAVAACALFTDQGLIADTLNDQYGAPRVIRATRARADI